MNFSAPVVNAVLRHGVTAASTAVLLLGTLAVIKSDDAAAIVASIQTIGSGLGTVFQGVGALLLVVSPWIAAWTSKQTEQIASVNAIPGVKVVDQSAPVATVTAVNPVEAASASTK